MLALLINTFLVKAFFIPSGSMERTLHGCPGCSGDRVLVNKVVYRLHEPRPGDIVVFAGPESWAPEAAVARPTNPVQRALRAVASTFGVATPGEKDFIKRVIAVGGQTVQCCDAEDRVTVDGRPLDEPYAYVGDSDYTAAPFGPVEVPAGRLWVMGDHRDQSADSRAHITDPDQGTIAVDDVIGKAFVMIWPVSRWGSLGTPADLRRRGRVALDGAGAGRRPTAGRARVRRRRPDGGAVLADPGISLDPPPRPWRLSARLLVVRDSALLFMRAFDPEDRAAGPWWEIPGGGVEPGEDTAAAAVRETAEETGYVVPAGCVEEVCWHGETTYTWLGPPALGRDGAARRPGARAAAAAADLLAPGGAAQLPRGLLAAGGRRPRRPRPLLPGDPAAGPAPTAGRRADRRRFHRVELRRPYPS